MTTIEKIMQTKTYNVASPTLKPHLISPASRGIIERALEIRDNGGSYIDWLKETTAGFAYKAIVKELF